MNRDDSSPYNLWWIVVPSAEKIPEIIAWGIRKNKMTSEQYLEGKGKENRPWFVTAFGRLRDIV